MDTNINTESRILPEGWSPWGPCEDYLIAAWEPCSDGRWPLDPRTASDLRGELRRLAVERGLGETLSIHGGVYGSADVVVARPRVRADALACVRYDPKHYPTIAAVCAIVLPGQPDEEATVAEADRLFDLATQPERIALEALATWQPKYPADEPPLHVECAMGVVHALRRNDLRAVRHRLSSIAMALVGSSAEGRAPFAAVITYDRVFLRALRAAYGDVRHLVDLRGVVDLAPVTQSERAWLAERAAGGVA